MKLVSFNDYQVGVVQDELVHNITQILPKELNLLPKQRMNWLIENWDILKNEIKDSLTKLPTTSLNEIKLLSPVPNPSHVFAAPANYQKHIGELQERAVTKKGKSAREQGFFLKAPASVIGANEIIKLPKNSKRRFDHESELAIIIGKHGRNINREEAFDYIFGYSCLIDLTMRIEPGTGEEERSMRKSFEGFTPIGPWIITADEVPNPNNLKNQLYVNDEIRQDANTSELIVGIAELIELISSVLPLQPGDIIATGTPEGVGPVLIGDNVKISIEKIGEMTVSIKEAEETAPRPY